MLLVVSFKYLRVLFPSERRGTWEIDRWIGDSCSNVNDIQLVKRELSIKVRPLIYLIYWLIYVPHIMRGT